MNPYRFATTGRLGQAFKSLIDSHYPVLQCTYFETQEALADQMHNYNAFAGFDLTDNIDISHIKWIHSFGAGVDAFMQLPLPQDILLTRTTGNMGSRMAEYCLAYMLYAFKSIDEVHQNQQQQKWAPLLLKDLKTASVLIFGTGNIGSSIAQVLQPLVHTVDGVNRSGSHVEGFHAIYQLTKPINYSQYDVIINTLPNTLETNGLFDEQLFALCNGSLFINVGRGTAVVQHDLLQALDEGHITKAVLDVFEEEPLPTSSPLWSHPGVVVTPHHASKTTADDVASSFKRIVEAIKAGIANDLFVDVSRGY
ncbi:MAG: D-2-hydroxyacid dehydrogenase [Fulvivirga sp.]